MRNNFLLITILFLAFNLNAQITLTSSTSSPLIGSSPEYVNVSSFTFDVSQSGPNQTWDFSSASGNSSSLEYISPSNSSEASTFPLANIVADYSTGFSTIENYLSSNDSVLSIEGETSPGSTIIYSDKKEVLRFPITYNDSVDDTFYALVTEIDITFNRTGTIKIKADGYGDLILPDTTINNVLRILTVYEYSDSLNGIQIVSKVDTVFTWYDTINNNPIASANLTYADGNQSFSIARYLVNLQQVDTTTISDTIVSINESFQNPISIYPNPSSNYLIVENEEIGIPFSMDIYDTKGLRVKTLKIQNGKTKIDLSDLISGVYFITYIKDSRLFTKKMFVNK